MGGVVVMEVEENGHAGPGAEAAFEQVVRGLEGMFERAPDVRPRTLEGRYERYGARCVARIRAGMFPEVRLEEVKKAFAEFAGEIERADCIARGNVDFYNEKVARLEHQLNLLTSPPPEPTERERLGFAIARLWTGPRGCPEIDELFGALAPGEKIEGFDWQGATIVGPAGARVLSRRALRLRSRPSYSTLTEDDWIARHAPIRPPEV
jgi:hypothetical protein